MRKTNNKETRILVQNYIKDSITDFIANYDGKTKEEQFNAFVENVNDNMYYDYIQTQQIFTSYLTNNVGVFTFYQDEQRELIKNWLDETNEQANKFSNNQVEDLFFNLLSMNIEKALNIRVCPIYGKFNQGTTKIIIEK